MSAHRLPYLTGFFLIALLALTACGGASSRSTSVAVTAMTATTAQSTTAEPVATGQVSSGPVVAAPTPAGGTPSTQPADGAACGNATAEVNKAINAIPEGDFVVDIEIEGACTVSVKTGDTQDAAASALKLCQAAEAPAYANGAAGISVTGSGGELAAGSRKSPCAVKS